MPPKHVDRYVQEFAGRHNVREFGIVGQTGSIAAALNGRHGRYKDLIADNGLPSGARAA